MGIKMRVICMYLPQYHRFPENDAWWGEGYTEWTAVKRAVPLYKGHAQPKHPYEDWYYDLEKEGVKTLKWQARIMEFMGFAFITIGFVENSLWKNQWKYFWPIQKSICVIVFAGLTSLLQEPGMDWQIKC